MCKLSLPLVALALLAASSCTQQVAPTNAGKTALGRYTLDGRTVRTTAKVLVESGHPDGTDELIIRVGIPPVGPRQEVLFLAYVKPAGSLPVRYKPAYITYNYTDSLVHGVNYNKHLHGKLKQALNGSYSGTFRATSPGSTSSKGSRVNVMFNNVSVTHPLH